MESWEKEFKSNLNLVKSDEHTFVILLISHKLYHKNDIIRLPMRHLIAIDGYSVSSKIIPLGGYVYDATKDYYIVNCVDHSFLTVIPFSFKLSMDNIGSWYLNVPFPVPMIKKHLSKEQVAHLEHFQGIYNEDEFNFKYVQFLVC